MIHHNPVRFISEMQHSSTVQKSTTDNAYERVKDKSHMIIPVDIEKALDKSQHHFLLKTFNHLEIEVKFLHLIKCIYEKPTSVTTFNA